RGVGDAVGGVVHVADGGGGGDVDQQSAGGDEQRGGEDGGRVVRAHAHVEGLVPGVGRHLPERLAQPAAGGGGVVDVVDQHVQAALFLADALEQAGPRALVAGGADQPPAHPPRVGESPGGRGHGARRGDPRGP